MSDTTRRAQDESNPSDAAEAEARNGDERLKRLPQPREIPPAPPAAPTPAEQERIREAAQALADKAPIAEVRYGETVDGSPVFGSPHTDIEGWQAQMKAAFGSVSDAFVEAQLSHLLTVLCATRTDEPLEMRMNAALAVIQAVAPRNEIEAMLAVRMAVTHSASMRMMSELERLNPLASPAGVAIAGNTGARLMRAFAS